MNLYSAGEFEWALQGGYFLCTRATDALTQVPNLGMRNRATAMVGPWWVPLHKKKLVEDLINGAGPLSEEPSKSMAIPPLSQSNEQCTW